MAIPLLLLFVFTLGISTGDVTARVPYTLYSPIHGAEEYLPQPFFSTDSIRHDTLAVRSSPDSLHDDTLRVQSSQDSLAKSPIADSVRHFIDTTRRAGDTTLHSTAQISDTSKSGKRRIDSLSMKMDTSAVRDTLVHVPRDSTARVAQFLYKREDLPVATPFAEHSYPLFLKPPSVLQRQVDIDSTGEYVTVREMIDGKDIRVPVKMPLSEYIKMRYKYEVRNIYESVVYRVETAKRKDDLGELLGTFTNIDIPIPANPVFSIFGPPRINLHISGAVDIRAAFRNTTTDQVTTSRLGNTRNEPDFAQEVQINVNGTIGDKLNILADWNTQRTFEYENQLKISYKGYEDEVVQSVEAGNVSLSTNSAFISSSSALFGIKAGFQFGPLRMTAIASQKKGKIEEKNITGGSQEIPFEKRAYDYSKDHFFVDTMYISTFEPYYTTLQGDSRLQIVDYEVWVTHVGLNDPNERQGVAYINLPPVTQNDTLTYKMLRDTATVPGEVEKGSWDKLEPKKDYTIHEFTGHITMNRSVQDGQAIAIAYRIANGPGPEDDAYYGTFTARQSAGDSILVLKLIKPKNLLPQHKIAWRLLLKNIYSLGGRNIQKSGFDLQLKYQLPGKEAVDEIENNKLLKVFGFDNLREDGSKGADNKFDYNPPYTIDESRGEIIFPSLFPFTEGIKKYFIENNLPVADADSFMYSKLYDTTQLAAQYDNSKDRFIISGKTTAGSSNTINLGFNIVENSVQVLLDGQPLTPNVDYTVDYIVGQVIIKNQAALVPGANLSIKYEQNDLFQLASKTLLGTRGEVKLSDKTSFGFTAMNLNQQTLSDKVRLNEEPMNNSIYGVDGQTSVDIDFLTKALDALPLLSTKAPSSLSVRGEMAYMSPNPNTKVSPIGIDGGKGIAYLDDFEGAKRTIPLGVGYGLWHDMSPPEYQYGVDSLDFSFKAIRLVRDQEKMYSKANTYWYTILPSDVSVSQIWGDKKQVARGQEQVTVLNVHYDPLKRGEYNYSPKLKESLLKTPKKNWGGMQRMVSSSAVDLVKENINFIEVWVQVLAGQVDSTKKILIDLGSISEDVIPNSYLDTEDKGQFKNGILNEGEDTGIDGLTDQEERSNAQIAAFIDSNKVDFPDIESDPAGDNWNYSYGSNDFRYINGTENNKNSENGRFPDGEDLNHNNTLDRTNSYFEYELNLDTTSANPQRVGGGLNSWYQYRIPLIDFKAKVGTPDFSLVEFVRVFFTGFDAPVEVRIAEFNLVGNQWEELKKNDSTFSVSTVNVEDNSPAYTSPPGVIRERDRTKPDEQVYGNEQSLNLVIRDMKDGENRQAIKRYTWRPLDVFSYREMRLFVHGEMKFNSLPATPDAEFFIRFGSDSLNYYEYRSPVLPGWAAVTIKFTDLTSIKQGRDSSNVRIVVPVKGGPDSSLYAVLGNPTLTRITFISIGIENPKGKGTTLLNGEVWINELRLSDVDDSPGYAYSFSTNLKLADFATIAFTMTDVDPNFHSLESRFGSRATNTNWNISTTVALEKLFPIEWSGTTLPFSYSHSEGLNKPKYLPSSDILVSQAAERQREIVIAKTGSVQAGDVERDRLISESQTLTTSDTYAVPTIKINVPSDNWFFRDIFNKFTYGFNYTTSYMRNPTISFRESWSWSSVISYGYIFGPDNYMLPFSMFSDIFFLDEFKETKIFFPITNFNFRLSLARSQTHERLRNQVRESEPSRGLSAGRQMSFGWKLTENGLLNLSGDYSVDVGSTLVHLEIDQYKRQRAFSDIIGDLFMKEQLVNFGYDNSYNQTININTKPRIPNIFEINKYLNYTFRYGVSYRWSNNLQQGNLGKGTSWGNSISMSSDISLKQFVETWFPAKRPAGVSQEQETEQKPAAPRSRGRREEDEAPAPVQQERPPLQSADTAAAKDSLRVPADTTKQIPDSTLVLPKPKKSVSLKETAIDFARILIKVPFLEYDRVNITFTQSNSSSNSGVPGRPGFANLFGRVPFFQKAEPRYGATRAYQFGFVSDPTSNITDVHLQPQFPFIGFDVDHGIRAANANISDGFSQSNKISLKTNRDLWTGARIDLTWNVGWDYSRNQTLKTDAYGRPTLVSTKTGGAVERSFFTLPPVFIFSMLKSGMANVGEKYKQLKDNSSDKRTDDAKLAEAFESGFESLPILRKIFGQYLPRVNYAIRWDGLEQYSFFSSFATRVGLDHAYNSTFRQRFSGNPSGGSVIESQNINYAFAPLLGMSITFKELFKGNVSANIRYGTTSSYDLTPSSKNIVENVTREMTITGSFARSGFEIPFFGLALSNDIDISFSYTYQKGSRQTFSTTEKITDKGTPGEGSTRSVIEPRIRYVLSARVTASLYYRYTKITPDEGGSRIPGQTTNEGGLDVHISIQ